MFQLTDATLYINDKPVGTVQVRGSSDSWVYGHFEPSGAFSEFAPLFGRWAQLMHADDDGSEGLSRHVADELRQIECALDVLQARLVVPQRDEPVRLAQINIDGPLIEWKLAEGLSH